MQKNWLGRSKYILLVLVAFLFVPALYAQPSSTTDAPRREPQDSPICKLLSDHFDRPISSFEDDFGPVISSKIERTFRNPSRGTERKIIKIEFAQHVWVTYVTEGTDSRELIIGVEAKGIEDLRKLGLDVHSFEDVQGLLGKPDSVEGTVMNYVCDELSAEFSIN